MGAHELDSEGFPVLPQFKASWCPIYWEPIEGSGERITFAIVSKSATGSRIHSVLRPPVVRALYGNKHAGVRGFFELVADSLTDHFNHGKSPTTWMPPISGIHVGGWRESLSNSLDGIVAQAVAQASSLSWADTAFYQEFGAMEDTKQRPVRKRMGELVKEYVGQRRQDLLPFFDQEGKLVDDGVPVRFGFVSPRLVAQFGLLRPSDLGRSYKDARGRLWELQKAANRAPFAYASLILHVPDRDDVMFDDAEIESAEKAFEELRLEARDDKVEVLPVHSTEEAGDAVLKLAA